MLTQYTREIADKGIHKAQRNMANGKPFRRAASKARARASAKKHSDGACRSTEGVEFHPAPRKSA